MAELLNRLLSEIRVSGMPCREKMSLSCWITQSAEFLASLTIRRIFAEIVDKQQIVLAVKCKDVCPNLLVRLVRFWVGSQWLNSLAIAEHVARRASTDSVFRCLDKCLSRIPQNARWLCICPSRGDLRRYETECLAA